MSGTFADFFWRLRKELKFTQDEMGKAIGVTQSWVSRIENGQGVPPTEALILAFRLAQNLGPNGRVKVRELIERVRL